MLLSFGLELIPPFNRYENVTKKNYLRYNYISKFRSYVFHVVPEHWVRLKEQRTHSVGAAPCRLSLLTSVIRSVSVPFVGILSIQAFVLRL